ncbi:MAG: ABC transporter permease [Bryobacteraceae bacterium]
MRLKSVLSEAAQALRFNRQRSVLTMVSLAWGVACFVILYSYGEGFGIALETAFRAVGQDLVLTIGGQTSSQAGGERAGRRVRLDVGDVEAIRESVPMVAAISPEAMLRGATAVRGYRTQTVTVRGIRTSYGRIRNMSTSAGRWINDEDESQKHRVMVIGAVAAQKLFGEIPPEGEEVRINGLAFTVVGVLRTKTQIANYNTPDNECLFIPFDTMAMLREVKYPDFIVWSPTNPVFRKDAIRQVRTVLARLHNFSPGDERAVEIMAFNEFMRVITTMTLALRVLLGFVGTLTLAIGGVGLANIMLVSVTERTREIGVLKSIGATRRSILFQFLAEAIAIVTLGGVFGVLAGYAVTSVLQTLPLLGPMFKDNSGQGDIRLSISSFAVITSTTMLQVVGLLAGLLPALKASRLDPIEALRYE